MSMQGINNDALELALDISSLLSFVNSSAEAKYFLKIIETDVQNQNNGIIENFSVIDIENNQEFVSEALNTDIANNTITLISTIASLNFAEPSILSDNLQEAIPGYFYSAQLEAEGGQEPYRWSLLMNYNQTENISEFPTATTRLNPTDNDDGFVVLNLPFHFPFYDTKSSKIVVNTDGSLIFLEEFNYLRTEQAIIDNKMLAVFASDLMIYPTSGDGIFYSGDTEGAVIRWKTSLFENEAANIDVAIKLLPSGEIQYFYGENITQGLAWAAGISNGDAINFKLAEVLNNTNPSGQKISFFPQEFPQGMSISKEGVFSGYPADELKNWTVVFRVTDYNNISKTKKIAFSTSAFTGINDLEMLNFEAYPNPTDGQVNFEFALEKYSSVKLQIFDLLGRKQVVLLDNNLNSGSQKLSFDLGKILLKGFYIYQFQIDNKVFSDKIIVR